MTLVTDNGSNDANSASGVIQVNHMETGTYTLQEITAPTGYQVSTTTYTAKLDDAAINAGTAATFNNDTPIPNSAITTSVTATKIWQDDNDASGRRDVVLRLWKSVDGAQAVEVTNQAKTILKGATGTDLTVTWKNLPTYEDGKPVTYSVTEDAIDGYTTQVSGDQTAGFTVTNTHEPKKPSTPTAPTSPKTPSQPSTTTPTNEPRTTSASPQTSDTTDVRLIVSLAVAGAACLMLGLFYRSRQTAPQHMHSKE